MSDAGSRPAVLGFIFMLQLHPIFIKIKTKSALQHNSIAVLNIYIRRAVNLNCNCTKEQKENALESIRFYSLYLRIYERISPIRIFDIKRTYCCCGSVVLLLCAHFFTLREV